MLRTVLAALLVVTALPAQERVPIVGRTHLANGSVWPGATIVLQSFVHPDWPQLGVTERLEVGANAQGRFRADALPGRDYVAFAYEVDAQGRQRCSNLATAGVAQPVELGATHDWLPPRTLKLTGAERHRAGGPLRVHWPAEFADPRIADAEGRVAMPPLPTPYAEVSVTTGEGHLLLRQIIATRGLDGLALPPPSPFLVRALDAPDGKPIAAAEVLLCWDWHEERLATTAADGFAIVDLACLRHGETIDSVRFRLLVRAAGRELGIVHVTDETARTNDELAAMRAKGQCQAFATLAPGRRHQGRVMLDATTPAANLPLLVQSTATVRHIPGASSARKIVRLAHSAADGTFELDNVVADWPLLVFAALPPPLAAQFAGAATPLVPLVVFSDVAATRNIPQDLGTTVLRELRPCSLQLRTPDGAPALEATVFCTVPARQMAPPVGHPDRKGRFTMLLPPKVGIDIAVAAGESSWLGRIGGLDAGGPITVPITLWPDRIVRCVVEDADGKAAPARLTLETTRSETTWQPPRDSVPGLVRVPDHVFFPLLKWLPTRDRREADGGYRISVPNVPGRWHVRADKDAARGFAEFTLDDEDVAPLRIKLTQR